MKYGIVLAGGGVRGAFQIGVWKALLKMNIEIGAAVGTSIGAINAALMAVGEYDEALRLWRNITINDILVLPDKIKGEENIFKAKNLAEIAKQIYSSEGLDMSPLEHILRLLIDEEELRKSDIEFGLATLSLTNMKGTYKLKKDIPEGKLVDFLMASASILTARQIEDEKFSDGALYDNMPVNMLDGMKNIITVDVQGVGFNRTFSAAGRNIISIRSQSPQTGIMDFDRAGIARSIDEGYIACMRAFGYVFGNIYAIYTDDYIKARQKYSEHLISSVEKAARILDVNPLEIYTFDGLTEIVRDKYFRYAQRAAQGLDGDKAIKGNRGAALAWLVKVMESGKYDFVGDKLAVFGDLYDAASAVIYFKN